MDIQLRSLLYGHMPVLYAFIQSIHLARPDTDVDGTRSRALEFQEDIEA